MGAGKKECKLFQEAEGYIHLTCRAEGVPPL